MEFWIYMLRCSDGSYYTGHTDALEYRVAQHRCGAIPDCYTFSRRPVAVVYTQDFATREEAFLAERQVKGWRREKKEALISGQLDLLPRLAKTSKNKSDGSSGVLRQAQDERIHGEAGRSERDRSERNRSEQGRGERALRSCAMEAGNDIARPEPVEGREHPMQPAIKLVDEAWMRRALGLADRAEREDDEIPVGALVVDAMGELVGEGWNRNIAEHDPSAHAEIVAMRRAGQALGNHRLVGCTLYVTLEPCAMCAMAMVHARLARVVFGASDPKTGAAGGVFDLLSDPRHNHRLQVQGGVLAEEAGARLTAYFRRKRLR